MGACFGNDDGDLEAPTILWINMRVASKLSE